MNANYIWSPSVIPRGPLHLHFLRSLAVPFSFSALAVGNTDLIIR
jgi:hypothetical protein